MTKKSGWLLKYNRWDWGYSKRPLLKSASMFKSSLGCWGVKTKIRLVNLPQEPGGRSIICLVTGSTYIFKGFWKWPSLCWHTPHLCPQVSIPQTGNEIREVMAPWEDVLSSVVPRKMVPHELMRRMRKERRKKYGNEVVLKPQGTPKVPSLPLSTHTLLSKKMKSYKVKSGHKTNRKTIHRFLLLYSNGCLSERLLY